MWSVRSWMLVALVALGSCGGDEAGPASTEKPGSPAKASSPAVPDALVGSWTRKFTKKDARRKAAVDNNLPSGGWTMRLTKDGTWETFEAGANPQEDCISQALCISAEMKADQSTMTPGTLPICPDPANYSYKIRGDNLTMTKTRDGCAAREWLLHQRTWRRG